MLVKDPNSPPRILIHLPNNPGGKRNYFEALKAYFEYDVSFFLCGKQGRKESKYGVFKRVISDFRDFYHLLKKGNFDLVHTNPTLNPKSFFRDSIFTLISCLSGVKTIVFWHGWRWEFEEKLVRKIKPYFRWTFGKADAMIFLAREFSDQVLSYGYPKPVYLETTVVEADILEFSNGIEISDVNKKARDTVTILFLSRVEIAKGIYELLDSYHTLQGKYPNIVLDIAGEGNELPNAKRYVAEKGIENVTFLGWVTGKKKAQIFQEASIYVLPSYSEGMPISLLEAMASGLPVITSNVGGIKDFFEPEKMGLLVERKNASGLAQQLERLLSDPTLVKRIGAYNAAYAQKRFTPKQVCRRLEIIYKQVISAGGA